MPAIGRAARHDDRAVRQGLSVKEMEHFTTDQIGVRVVRPDRRDEKRHFGNLAGMRKWIESAVS